MRQIEDKLRMQDVRRRQEEDKRIRNMQVRAMSMDKKKMNYNNIYITNMVRQPLPH